MNKPPFIEEVLLIAFTILIYLGCRTIHDRYKKWWLMPIIITPIIIFFALKMFAVPLADYHQAMNPIIWFLGPASAAFAIPIYEQRKIIVENGLVLSVGVLVGIVVTVVTTLVLSWLVSLSPIMTKSMLAHSLSTPFAIIIAPHIAADVNFAAVFAVITGVFGMLIGELMLLILKSNSPIVRGMVYGTGASVVGTSRAIQIGQTDGVISSLAMVLTGVVMILMAPLLGWLVNYLF